MEEKINTRVGWIENDLKVEMLAIKMKFLRKEYIEKNPEASQEQIDNYINRKLQGESDSILKEQFQIIFNCGL